MKQKEKDSDNDEVKYLSSSFCLFVLSSSHFIQHIDFPMSHEYSLILCIVFYRSLNKKNINIKE